MSDVTPTKTIRCDWRTPVDDPAVDSKCTATVTYENTLPLQGGIEAMQQGWRFGRGAKDFCPEHAPMAQINGLVI